MMIIIATMIAIEPKNRFLSLNKTTPAPSSAGITEKTPNDIPKAARPSPVVKCDRYHAPGGMDPVAPCQISFAELPCHKRVMQ